MPAPVRLIAVSLCLALAAACGRTSDPQAPEVTLRVGSWPAVEPHLLAETLAGLLRLDGIGAEVVEFADDTDARRALELEDVDVLPAYTGAAWLEVMERSDPPGSVATSFARVREFDERQDLVWVPPRFGPAGWDAPPANATFALVVAGPPSGDAELQTVSQLASRLSADEDAQLCLDEDFGNRPDGRDALFRAYGISLERQDIAASPEQVVSAVLGGDCLAGLTTATEGRAWAAGLRPLVDDLQVFPAFVVAAVATRSSYDIDGVAAALGPFAAQLTSRLLAEHNARVLDGEAAEAVAADLADVLRQRAGREADSEVEP